MPTTWRILRSRFEDRIYCRSGASFRLAIDDKNCAFQPALSAAHSPDGASRRGAFRRTLMRGGE